MKITICGLWKEPEPDVIVCWQHNSYQLALDQQDVYKRQAFTSDLPLGQYYVKEIEAPKGYVKSDKIFDVDASYQGDKVRCV